MISIGTKVCVTDFADFILHTGYVKKIENGKAVIKFPGKSGEHAYNIDDLEEVTEIQPVKKSRKSA